MTLYFGNTGACGPEVWSLTTTSNEGTECGVIKAGAQGSGLLGTDDYVTAGKKAVGYKLDTKRKLTGTIHIQTLIGATAAGQTPTAPAPVAADITVSVNGIQLGVIKASGVTGPGSLVVPVSLTIPASLKNKPVKAIDVAVKWTEAFWATTVSYSGTTISKLSVPTL
jgi:uncharacterized protein involved in outer membrane biogenesis